MHDETLESEEKQFTTILNIDCTMSNKSKSRLYFKDDRGQMQHVNVGYTDCKRYSIGDTIQIYKNKEGSWFELGQTK